MAIGLRGFNQVTNFASQNRLRKNFQLAVVLLQQQRC
jgi:hypothetical protein